MRYAVIRDSDDIVVNTIELVDLDSWPAPEGHYIVEASTSGEIGDHYVNGDFVEPPSPQPSIITPEELL